MPDTGKPARAAVQPWNPRLLKAYNPFPSLLAAMASGHKSPEKSPKATAEKLDAAIDEKETGVTSVQTPLAEPRKSSRPDPSEPIIMSIAPSRLTSAQAARAPLAPALAGAGPSIHSASRETGAL
ncbi:MAG: hypothetical protein BWZ10_02408 [candidate division BRC1 bacterium ADurb.BinA364]|nr:MAG: hypothetical protein BWZ10_02408 [candidate division BRC1 bacterium ADurb.BinA364]